MQYTAAKSRRGVSFIEVLVGAAIIALIFGGIIGGFQFSLILLAQTRAQTGALALANDRIEYLRSMPYDSVGTIAGIPSGSVAQNEAVTLNAISYNRRTLIQYVDSPADGFGGADSNGITADYKRAKVEISWLQKGVTKSLSLVTNVIPKGMETLAGGGTLIANVFDAAALPVSGAAVRVVNASTSPAIDVTANTTATGQVIFPGAPEAGGYQISVTKAGYSSSQTYSASTSNPNPNPPHVAVVESLVSTVNFAIDDVATLNVRTVEPPSDYTDTDTFANSFGLVDMATTTVSLGGVVLLDSAGAYYPLGVAYATATAPANLVSWNEARMSYSAPPGTSALFRIYSVDTSGVRTLVSDTDVPGNAAGLTVSPIDLSNITPGAHPRIALSVELATTDASTTPEVLDWEIEYSAANVPIPNINFTLFGTKNIGTDGGGQPVLKYTVEHQTDAGGEVTIPNLEWDAYSFSINGGAEGYDISDVCPKLPISLAPGEATTTTLVLSPHTTNSLRVTVLSSAGVVLDDADVHVTRGGYDETQQTSACGNTLFESLSSAADYTVETSKTGFQIDTLTNVTVGGTTALTITLVP